MSKKPSGNLQIELVPATAWGINLRSMLKQTDWDKVRRYTYRQANYLCEICGGKGLTHPVECHEVWSYDDENKVQKLERCIALCPACHKVKHIGRTGATGGWEEAIQHLMAVNNWGRRTARGYIADVFAEWEQRSKYEWTLNILWVQEILSNA